MSRVLSWALVIGSLLVAGTASAQSWVAFLHTPPEVQPARAELVLAGSLIGAGTGVTVQVRYRAAGAGAWQTVPVLPSYGDTWEAVIPAGAVVPPAIEYFVEAVPRGGTPGAIFASAEAPQRVRVTGPGESLSDPPPDAEPDGASAGGNPDTAAPGAGEPGTGDPPGGQTAIDAALADELALFAAEDTVTLATLTAQSVTVAPAIVSVVSDDQIREMGARTVWDVLKTIPGLETSRDVQGFHRLGVRGIRSDPEILLLYDGHRLANLFDGRNLYELPVEGIERIEVIRGPGSSLYGAGAFLAVINVVPADLDGLRVAGSWDTNNVGNGHASYGFPVGDGRIQLDADLEAGRGYREPVVADAFHEADPREPIGYTDDSHLLAHGGVRGRHAVGAGEVAWSVRAIHQQRAPLIGAFDALGTGALDWTVLLGDLRYRQQIGSAELVVRAFGDNQEVRREFQLTPAGWTNILGKEFPDGVFERVQHASRSAGAEATLQVPLFQGNALTAGLSVNWQHLVSWTYAVNMHPETGDPVDAGPVVPADVVFPAHDAGLTSRIVAGAFAQDVWTLTEGLDLTLGFRADVFSGGVGREPGAPVGEPGLEFALNPRAGLVWHPSEKWTFKGMFATAFRVPTFEELTSIVVTSEMSRGRFVGSPVLQPVHIRTAEVAAEHAFAAGEHRARIRVNGFMNRFFGRIEAIDLTGVVSPLTNQGETVVYGAEGEGRVDFSPRDRVSAGMAWSRAIDQDAPAGRNLLTDVPQLRFILQTQVGMGDWFDLHLGATFGAERRNNARSSLEALRRFDIPPYALLRAAVSTRPIQERFVVAVTIENLLDVPYRDDVQRPDRITDLLPGPGLSARLTLRAHW